MAHNKIPEECDKILFAEDVVRHIFYRTRRLQYEPKIAHPYREFIYEAYTRATQAAIHDICKRVKQYNRLFNVELDPLSEDQFVRFAIYMMKRYFSPGFDPKFFLIYSVHLGVAASKMVEDIGLQRAGDLAVRYVLKGFKHRDMFTGGWDVLHMTASNYAKRRNFIEDFTEELMVPQDFLDYENELNEEEADEDDDDDSFYDLTSNEDFDEDNEHQNADDVNVLDNEAGEDNEPQNDDHANVLYNEVGEVNEPEVGDFVNLLLFNQDAEENELGNGDYVNFLYNEAIGDNELGIGHYVNVLYNEADEDNEPENVDYANMLYKEADEDNEPENVDDTNVLDNETDEDNSDKTMENDSGHHPDQKNDDGEHSREKNLNEEQNLEESDVEEEVRICLEIIKDILEREMLPHKIFSSSDDEHDEMMFY